VIALLSQLVIVPVKIFMMVRGRSRRFLTRWPATVMWYMNAVPPAVSGT